MATIEDTSRFSAVDLRDWSTAVFRAVGLGGDEAALVADSLVEADLRGVESHGIARLLCTYVDRIRQGLTRAATRIEVLRDRPSTALLDCHNSMGQVGAARAMALAIDKAAKTGVAFVAAAHSNHYGAGAYWAMIALERGMIGFTSANTPAMVAPAGGVSALLGTNPFAVAIPAGREPPFVLDLATTVVSRGKIALHAKQNKPLEPGWAFDERGQPTVDPQEAMRGLLAPIGGYKGYGISLAIDLLCGVMTASSYGTHFPGFLADMKPQPMDVGSVFAAIDVASFMDIDEFKATMDKALREVKDSRPAAGVARIYVPGEIALRTKKERLAAGVPLPSAPLAELRGLGDELGIAFPATLPTR